MRTRKQKIILTAKITAITAVVVVLISVFVFRDLLLQQAISRVSLKMERDYDSTFSVKKAAFVGISGLSLSEVVLAPKNVDTLFSIQNMKTSVSLWHLLLGDIQLGTLEVSNGFVQLVKNEKGRNFDAFQKYNSSSKL